MSDTVQPQATTPTPEGLTFEEVRAVFNRLAKLEEELRAERNARLALAALLESRTARFHAYVTDQAKMMRYLTSAAESCVANL